MDVYRRLVHWELELSSTDSNMMEILKMQKEDANNGFAKYIKKNYMDWVAPNNPDHPMMSTDIFKKKVFPLLNEGEKVFFIVIDNFNKILHFFKYN